ncbi:MAG: amidohydrolase family protein [Gemmatimonadetes bacterium]|nr:amidohydrolase family protein [Gemmatimonadota bacterium]NIR80933.1 amidohydrolase family protein [Gemmatimonadota bacterium]NIT89751.1 amidohydrolase family protein [Gemmatimonadota bacterium]NIU33537.1 amidohydrolase family protein [Gemmatimonadota bacterium]NIU37807.1 amidohydrolase family protein [Gemmatimonadota bacterium]
MAKLPLPVAAAAIEEAHRYGIRVLAHTFTLADSKALIRAGVDGFAHPPWREREPDEELVGLFEDHPDVFVLMTNWSARNRIYGPRPAWIDEPLLRETFSDEQIALLERPETPGSAPAEWRAGPVPRSVAKLEAAGVRFGLGSDVGGNSGGPYFGWSSHMEMAIMVEAGLSPGEAIVAATRNSAEFLGAPELGMVAPGRSADFLVLDANPLDEIANTRTISTVYLRGREVDRAGLMEKWRAERSGAVP